jgi:hypothetical protein
VCRAGSATACALCNAGYTLSVDSCSPGEGGPAIVSGMALEVACCPCRDLCCGSFFLTKPYPPCFATLPACTAANCAACNPGSATTCATCQTGYTLRDGQCSLGNKGSPELRACIAITEFLLVVTLLVISYQKLPIPNTARSLHGCQLRCLCAWILQHLLYLQQRICAQQWPLLSGCASARPARVPCLGRRLLGY